MNEKLNRKEEFNVVLITKDTKKNSIAEISFIHSSDTYKEATENIKRYNDVVGFADDNYSIFEYGLWEEIIEMEE